MLECKNYIAACKKWHTDLIFEGKSNILKIITRIITKEREREGGKQNLFKDIYQVSHRR